MAFLNLDGGHILLGVEDDGTVSGLAGEPKKAEEWVMEIARTHVRPACIPYWETIPWQNEATIGVIHLPANAPDKPYKAKRGSAWVTQVRVGSTARDATGDEEARLYMPSGRLSYDRRPVAGSKPDDLDPRRLTNFFRDLRGQDCPPEQDAAEWTRLLLNTEILIEDRNRAVPSVAGMLLFGLRPNRYLPQAGLTAVAYPGMEKDYAAKARGLLRGPVVSLFDPRVRDSGPYHSIHPRAFSENITPVESGMIEQALHFVRGNIDIKSWIDQGGQRQERWDYPLEAVREALVNAIAHRDYTISVCDIELSVYADRIEIVSPGRLPTTVTVEKMRAGYRASRNELIKEILRDYRYIEATGLGVPRKIVRGMKMPNGTDPDLIEEEDRFTVRLWKEKKHA